jgi:hypothetical protein
MAKDVRVRITAENKQMLTAVLDCVNSLKSLNINGTASLESIRVSSENTAKGIKELGAASAKSASQTAGSFNRILVALESCASSLKSLTTQGSAGLESLNRIASNSTKIMDDVGNVANRAGNRMGDAGRRGSAAMDSATTSAHAFGQKLANVTIIANGVMTVLGKIKDVISSAVAPGVEYTNLMDSSRIGLAGILLSMTQLNGRQLELNEALSISDQTFKNLQERSLRFNLSVTDTATAFQAIVAPGLAAEMSMEQIVALSVQGTKAVKSMMAGSSNVSLQISQELRAMISGDIDQNSQVAKALGITSAQIAEAKDSAGGLFAYLTEKMKGFTIVAGEIPKTLAGKIDMIKTASSMISAQGFEPLLNTVKGVFDEIVSYLIITTTKTDEFGNTIKNVKMNPEIIGSLKDVSNFISMAARDFGNFSITIARLASGPARGLVSVLVSIYDYTGKIALSIVAWMIISKIRALVLAILPALQLNLAAFRMLVATSGMFQASIFAAGVAIKSLLITSGWGILAVAIGTAADEALRLYQNLTKSGKAKADYFKEKEAANAPLSQQLEGKLQAPIYYTNPDVNKAGMNQESLLKLEKFISAINYMYPDKAVTLTSGKRDWGGHVTGNKADIAVDGMEDPLFRGALIKAAKDFGIAVIDEVEARASDSPEARANWGPHLDLDMSSSGTTGSTNEVDASGLTLIQKKQMKEDLLRAIKAYNNALAEGETKKYIADLEAQEATAKQDRADGKIGISEYYGTIREILIKRTYAEIEDMQLEINEELTTHSNKNLSQADIMNSKAKIAKISADIKVSQTKLNQMLQSNSFEQRQELIELYDKGTDAFISYLELQGKSIAAAKAKLNKSDIAKTIKTFRANDMNDAADAYEAVANSAIIAAQVAEATTTIDAVQEDIARSQAKLIRSVIDGNITISDAIKAQQDDFNANTSAEVAKLQTALDNAKAIGWTSEIRIIEQKLRDIHKQFGNFATTMIEALDADLQKKIDDINNNPELTTGQKKDLIDRARMVNGDQKISALQYDAGGVPNADQQENIDKQELFNNRMKTTLDLTSRVGVAAKQSFEDGLLTFLTDGITKCDSLADAFRNLLTTVLSSIQRMYAEAVNKNIMNALFPSKKSPVETPTFTLPTQTVPAFAEGGSMESGLVKGPGTSISDSILAYASNFGKFLNISDGEFVMKGKAVKTLGVSALNALNNGVDPRRIFKSYATGGSLIGNSVASMAGPQDIAASLQSGDVSVPLKVVNVTDPNEVGRYLSSRPGERVMVNFMKNNAGIMRQILNIKG